MPRGPDEERTRTALVAFFLLLQRQDGCWYYAVVYTHHWLGMDGIGNEGYHRLG